MRNCICRYKRSIKIVLKRLKTRFWLKIKFSFLKSRMVNMDVFFNALSFGSQILSYKRFTDVTILCFVKKARVLLLFRCVVLHGLSFNEMVL